MVWIPQFTKKITSRPARLILDGFNFSSIVTVANGQGLTGTINGNPGAQTGIPGPLAGGLTGGTVNNSGTALSSSRFPGQVRNAFTGPGLADVDFRIGRQFALGEKARLSFIGEAFNVFNFTNFFAVNSTEFNYSGAGSGVCAGHTNGCVALNPAFLAPTASNNGLYGARQLQISGRLTF